MQQSDSDIGTVCAGGICRINFSGSGCSVSKPGPGQKWTVNCTSGSVTNNPGGIVNGLQINNGAGAFGAIADPLSAGKVLISQPSGPAVFADPLVQGLYADGASNVASPVIGGGYDTAGTPLIHRFTMASTSPGGSDWGLVTRVAGSVAIAGTVPVSGTFWQAVQPVSGTFWQATQPVSIASMPSTPVTGTFWQATQPVSGTFWQATQPISHASLAALQFDGSNFLKVIFQNSSLAVTGTFWQATQPVSGTFWQSTQPVSIASMPSTPVTGTFWQTTQPVSGTFWQATQPVSLASVPLAETQSVATASTTNSALEAPIVSAATTNSTSVKGSAGNVYGIELYNTTTTIYYLRLYNTAAAPTCSSATGFLRSIPVVPAGAAGGAGGQIIPITPPVGYGTGIGYCLTGGSSSTDNTAAAVGIFGAIRYK